MLPRLQNCRLYGFIDVAYLGERDPQLVTRQLIAGGVDIIQVRAKEFSHDQRIELGLAVIGVAMPHRVPVIINDDIVAARVVGADGVHLGQEDFAAIPANDRAAQLAEFPIVGISTHSLDQAVKAEADGASYIGVGPIYPTNTKPGVRAVGLELIKQVATKIRVPFFAIGGINHANLGAVREAGASRVAVVSAILTAPDVTAAAREIRQGL